jgi:hypothetical protein
MNVLEKAEKCWKTWGEVKRMALYKVGWGCFRESLNF